MFHGIKMIQIYTKRILYNNVEQFLYDFQYLHSYPSNKQICAPRVKFFMSMWLICSYFSTCCCNASGITIHLSFMTTLSIIAMLSLSIQYILMSCHS